jgi:hypothetical protein
MHGAWLLGLPAKLELLALSVALRSTPAVVLARSYGRCGNDPSPGADVVGGLLPGER